MGQREPLAAAQALHDFGVNLAVVKQGPKGVLGRTDRNTGPRDAYHRCRSRS